LRGGRLNMDVPIAVGVTMTAAMSVSETLRSGPYAYFDAALTLLFFLLHEQPEAVRRQTLAEALRVTAPGGRIVIADYHCPSRWHPLYYLFRPVLALLEPYALDLWRRDISNWLPEGVKVRVESHRTFFGGLYQLLVLVRE
jgi:SAM-dependent methyltransferase